MASSPVLVDHQGATIDFFESVPNTLGQGVIRLPRCQNCFDEVHDYDFGKAYCIPAELSCKSRPMRYVRMGADQLARWTEAEREEQERREKEVK